MTVDGPARARRERLRRSPAFCGTLRLQRQEMQMPSEYGQATAVALPSTSGMVGIFTSLNLVELLVSRDFE